MLFKYLKALLIYGLVVVAPIQAEPLEYYFPEEPTFRSNIPTPQSILDFEVGDRHVRHDQLIQYFKELANSSENVVLTQMGKTNEHRQQIIATISSKKNIENLDAILADRRVNKAQNPGAPAVIWLGYSIHGNEISGSNASMLVAYYLAAAKTSEVTELLDNLIIVIEPSMNPDGMDRFTTWVNGNRNKSFNSDPEHRSHQLQWPSGRTNHYMFDLNRDWLPLTQIESQNRVRNFHYYKPNVLGDFHEMEADGTYFFQPGVPSRNNPLTPAKAIELTNKFATYHAKALDNDNRLYYSEESFDDFYYGKGSTYPDINGGLGILFEQASSRGYATATPNGVLTFGFGIKNHLLTSFSTLTAALENKAELHQFREDFYNESLKLAAKEDFDGFLINEDFDRQRLNSFLTLLSQHQIKSYPLSKNHEDDHGYYRKENSYFVPIKQDQYRLIKTLFSKTTEFENNTFYDVSGWTMPLAFNISSRKIGSIRDLKFSSKPWQAKATVTAAKLTAAYAYAFSWDSYLAPKLLNQLLNKGIQARVASKPFSQLIDGKLTEFSAGTIVIPTGIQQLDNWFEILTAEQKATPIKLIPLTSGLTPGGIDLGSPSLKPLTPIKVLLLGGHGVSQYEAGHMLYYLDEVLGIPVSIVDLHRTHEIDVTKYTHIILVDGEYPFLSDTINTKIKRWLQKGGIIYAQQTALRWLSGRSLLEANFISKNAINRAFDTDGLSYGDKEQQEAKQRIAGAIFNTKVDLSHPLMFGYHNSDLAIFKNRMVMMEQPSKPFMLIAGYKDKPLLSGYSADEMTSLVAHNAAIVAHNVGEGRIIASTENLVFRGYWQGTSKIVANALFFSKAFSVETSPK